MLSYNQYLLRFLKTAGTAGNRLNDAAISSVTQCRDVIREIFTEFQYLIYNICTESHKNYVNNNHKAYCENVASYYTILVKQPE